jgi:hypothetical protein
MPARTKPYRQPLSSVRSSTSFLALFFFNIISSEERTENVYAATAKLNAR